MKQLTISKFGMSVFVDGISLINLPLAIPNDVASLNWFDEEIGDIFKIDGSQEKITKLPTWAQTCVEVYTKNLPKPNPAPTPEEINKQEAQAGLYETDWTSIPDITDPAKCIPTLTNQAEFLQYRNQLRAIVLNPPSTLVQLPVKPKAKWSN